MHNHWESVFDSISDKMMILTPDRQILKVSKSLLEYMNLEAGHVIGRKCSELFGSSKCDTDECLIYNCINSKQPIEGLITQSCLDMPLYASIIPITDPNEKDNWGRLVPKFRRTILGVVIDMRDLLKSLEIEAFKTITNNIKDGIIIVNYNDVIIYYNNSLINILLCKSNEILNKTILEFSNSEFANIIIKHRDEMRIISGPKIISTNFKNINFESISVLDIYGHKTGTTTTLIKQIN